MIIGSEVRAHNQLKMMSQQITLWLNAMDQNVDLLKALNKDDRWQLSYMMNLLKDHLNEYSLRIIS